MFIMLYGKKNIKCIFSVISLFKTMRQGWERKVQPDASRGSLGGGIISDFPLLHTSLTCSLRRVCEEPGSAPVTADLEQSFAVVTNAGAMADICSLSACFAGGALSSVLDTLCWFMNNFHSNPGRETLLSSPFSQGGNWGTERLSVYLRLRGWSVTKPVLEPEHSTAWALFFFTNST